MKKQTWKSLLNRVRNSHDYRILIDTVKTPLSRRPGFFTGLSTGFISCFLLLHCTLYLSFPESLLCSTLSAAVPYFSEYIDLSVNVAVVFLFCFLLVPLCRKSA